MDVTPRGRYAILAVLSSGAFADVCVVRDDAGETLALKVLRGDGRSDPDAVERFLDEARILTALDHPGIVQARRLLRFAAAEGDGEHLVLELEYVHGLTLERVLEEERFPARAALGVVLQVASALDAAYHGPFGPFGAPMRIVHRDLKPANVVMTAAGAVKLLDFGIAKGDFSERHARSLHNVWGSVGYEAPERRSTRDAGPESDVYALGAMGFVLMTGRPLILSHKSAERHDADLAVAMRHALQQEQPPEALTLLRRMLAFGPEQRPTMAEVARAAAGVVSQLPGPELAEFASHALGNLVTRVKIQPPKAHGRYAALQFLENQTPVTPEAARSPEEASSSLRAEVGGGHWTSRRVELRDLLAAGADPGPLLRVLDRANPPWWKFWVKSSAVTEIETALLLLADHPVGVAHAQRMMAHADERIARAARFVMGRARRTTGTA